MDEVAAVRKRQEVEQLLDLCKKLRCRGQPVNPRPVQVIPENPQSFRPSSRWLLSSCSCEASRFPPPTPKRNRKSEAAFPLRQRISWPYLSLALSINQRSRTPSLQKRGLMSHKDRHEDKEHYELVRNVGRFLYDSLLTLSAGQIHLF